jgi:hypothetical protein
LDDEYGPVFGAAHVQIAVVNTLQKWLPTYIAAANRNIGSEVLFAPIDYRHRPDYRTLPKSSNTVALLVTVPGTASEPITQPSNIRTHYRVEVAIFVYGSKDWQETEALTQAYGAMVRTCLIQHRDLGHFAEGTKWEGEEYKEGDHASGRTIGLGNERFIVTLTSVMNPMGGPPAPQFAATGTPTGPDTDPPPPIPTIGTTSVVVQAK